jgi:hypothetical protein
MDINLRIEYFATDIYFKLPNEIKNDYISICEELDKIFDNCFSNNRQMLNQKNDIFLSLLRAMETKDFIRMADMLLYTIKPLLD